MKKNYVIAAVAVFVVCIVIAMLGVGGMGESWFVPFFAVGVIVAGLLLYMGQSDKSAEKSLNKTMNEIGSADSAEEYDRKSAEYAAKHPAIRPAGPDFLADLTKKYRNGWAYFLALLAVVLVAAGIAFIRSEGFGIAALMLFIFAIAAGAYSYFMLAAVPVKRMVKLLSNEAYNEFNSDYMSGDIYKFGSSGICIGQKYAVYYTSGEVTIINLADVVYAGKFIRQVKNYTNGVYTGSTFHYIVRLVTRETVNLTTGKPANDFYPEFNKYGLHQVLAALESRGVPVHYEMNI